VSPRLSSDTELALFFEDARPVQRIEWRDDRGNLTTIYPPASVALSKGVGRRALRVVMPPADAFERLKALIA